MLADQSDWRTLAERAAKEQDPEQLMAIVEELSGVLAQRDTHVRQRRGIMKS